MTTGHALALPPEPAVVEPTVSTVASHTGELGDGSRDEESFNRQRLLGTVASLLQRSMSPPQQQPISSPSRSVSEVLATRSDALLTAQSVSDCLTSASTLILDHIHPATPRPVKETKYVSLEYDPASKRKVLNTYEILREIGRGEHGKVKLAKNLVNNELVAIKIVSRRSKDRSLRMRRHSTQAPSQRYINEYEAKIKREIAIMKRCDHKHIVRFKEVLDDRHSYKIYLVLEYMDRGEIKWKRQSPITSPRPLESLNSEKIPCWAGTRRMSLGVSSSAVATEDNDLLSREFSPNLTFRQSRRIFRDVLLGLEYLHMQGIVHRDIKPANLLVSADYTVKISDFGVSFASSLGSTDDGIYFSDMELAKTVGTPAFFAPELCQTSITDPLESQDSPESLDSSDSSRAEALDYPSLPKVDHKIDIWAMGVTLYCLLFGRVPFNADSEFALFDVIVNEELEFPTCRSSFFSPQEVSEKEFELAKDLLRKMLDKNSRTRIDIAEIKCHDFVLMDLEDDPERLHEFYFLNAGYAELLSTVDGLDNKYRSENNSPAVGIAKRVSGSLLRAFSNESGSSIDSGHVSTANNELQGISEINKALEKISCLQSRTKSSEESGSITSPKNNHQKSPSNTSAGIASSQWLPKVSQDSSHSSTSMLNPSTQHTRRGSIVHANSLLQDVRDYGTGIRRDSSGSQEAPQIETKRNVGGDLYMKNQSAIEAFKDIQKSDKKRRKSNLFTTLSRSSSTNGAKQSKAAITSPTQASIAEPVPICTGTETSSKIKVGPISIDSNRRASSVISLPLTESFASLDSFNDAYLSNKYQEFKKRKHAMRLLDDTITQSDSALMKAPDVSQGITEKFRAFNLSHSMSKEGQNTGSDSRVDSDAVAPRQGKKPFASLHESPESSSYSSSCSSSSSSENEEEGNLTLKFTSKVAPRSRPPFLSLSNRAFSHDSNLTDLVNSPKSNYYTPFSFQNSLDDLEDVPESLMGAESTEQHSQITANAPISKEVFSLRKDLFKSKAVQNNPAQSSPLRSEVVGSSDSSKPEPVMQVALDEHLSSKAAEDRSINIDGGYFNNHYKKEQVRYPLPFSKHLDSDKQSQAKQQSEGLLGLDVRPNYNRSNSITLGLLQHEPLDFE